MADIDEETLAEALKKSKLREAEQLLLYGVNPNGLVEQGFLTPMHLAAGLGMPSVCLLLQHGGDPNVCIQDRTTPLHVAAMWGDADSVQILLANGGDPFLKDLDGMSALDLANQYSHEDVRQVLHHFRSLLSAAPDQTLTPKFTYFRRSSFCSSGSQQSASPGDQSEVSSADGSLYDTQVLHDYLTEFARRRRSSVYLRSVQSQMDRYFNQGQKTHLFNVTSPDHPYVEPRHEAELTDEPSERSLNLHLSLSEDEQSTCDSFVTCDGEDLDTVLKDTEDSPFDRSLDCLNTVKKNPKFNSNNSCSSNSTLTENTSQERQSNANRSRGDKYCRREPLFQLPDLSSSSSVQKCDFCGCAADITDPEREETACQTCRQFLIELDMIQHEAAHQEPAHQGTTHRETAHRETAHREAHRETAHQGTTHRETTHGETVHQVPAHQMTAPVLSLPDLLQSSQQGLSDKPYGPGNVGELLNEQSIKYIQVGKSHRAPPKRDALTELSRQLRRTSLNTPEHYVEDKSGSDKTGTVAKPVGKENFSVSASTTDSADIGFCKSDLSDSLISADSTFLQPPVRQARFRPSDISTITLSDDSYEERNVLDQACVFTRDEEIKPKITHQKTEASGSQNIESLKEKQLALGSKRKAEGIRHPVADYLKKTSPGSDQSPPEINELWSEVRASSLKRRQMKGRNVLDTAFCGRDSVGSVLSDASAATVEYVYTDKETGITLLERHIPSQCGSAGSRRSLDSLFSQNTNEGSPRDEPGHLNSSQDTILYDLHDNAMLQHPDGEEDKDTTNDLVSPQLLNLDDNTLRKTLIDLGEDPGPITKTTRQAYLRRLSSIQNDPDHKVLSKKGPNFPSELSLALRGSLDLSEMAPLELKMVATFQNPDRQRRWREGTLKSSFNYILLDPRITRDLPNRAQNMTDLEVFQTFVYATFYVGKGKRARPYSHLYEAIREMKKQSGKGSEKIQRILEIWAGDQGVVSLHCFQSVIPVEAYTREACMVDALGLAHLTNKKRGDYYGVSTTWSMKQRRKMGVYLLSKALQIFLAEGERQISPLDIKNDP